MNFKDYSARIEYSDEDGCFIGHIAGIRKVAMIAEAEGKSLNAWAQEALQKAITSH